MKKLLLTLFLIVSSNVYSQTLIQTWTDRCTGEVSTFSISMTGYTTVVFYNKVGQFTAADVQSGALRTWMEETYYWWSQLSPCSTNQASSTAAQDTAANAASSASSAAANASSGASSSTSTGTSTGATGASSSGTSDTSSSSSSSNNSSSDSSSSSSSSSDNSGNGDSSSSSESSSSGEEGSSSEGSSTEEGSSSEEGSSTEEGSSSEESSSEESSTEESSSESEEVQEEEVKEEKSEEKKEEKKEDKKEEEKKEDKKEEEEKKKKEEEEKKKKEEEEKKKKKKKILSPPIVSANIVGMSMIDGSFTQAASFGFSQASLTGEQTYSANAMIWSNLRQFSLTVSKSTVNFNYDRNIDIIERDPFSGKRRKFGSYKGKGSIAFIQSQSIGYMNMFGTSVIVTGFSNVVMGQKDNFWKGFVGGYAVNGMGILPKGGEGIFTASITLFGTKPFVFDRVTVSPMIAYSASPVMYMLNQKKANITPHGVYIFGSNFDFNLTKRFKANLGITTVGSTQAGIPLSYSLTIGSRFAF